MNRSWNPSLLGASLATVDPELSHLADQEHARQTSTLSLLAPSMIVPTAVRQALVSPFLDLDAEGYARMATVDEDLAGYVSAYWQVGSAKYAPSGPFAEYAENLAARRLARLFGDDSGDGHTHVHVNVQALSGSMANVAILDGLLEPGDSLVAMSMPSGGHLSHGAPIHISGRTYSRHAFDIDAETGEIDLGALTTKLRSTRAKVVIVGGSSYPRHIDWGRIREAVDSAGTRAILVADVAHFAGLIAADLYPNPLPHTDVVSMVGYKTLGGPRSGVVLTKDPAIARAIDRALFPGLQSAPMMSGIVALAAAAGFAAAQEFRALMASAVSIARLLVDELAAQGHELVFGGTDSHMIVVRLPQTTKGVVHAMEQAGILANSNIVPYDSGPGDAHGVRMGTVTLAQRGLSIKAVPELARLVGGAMTALGTGQAGPDDWRSRIASFVERELHPLPTRWS